MRRGSAPMSDMMGLEGKQVPNKALMMNTAKPDEPPVLKIEIEVRRELNNQHKALNFGSNNQ